MRPAEACGSPLFGAGLLNSSRFCVSPKGDFSGNNATWCYWGLPSVSADDPAFPQLGYWRGFVWGPMALLVYWGLARPETSTVPIVETARTALCKQMRALFLSQWRRHRHVCENFSPRKAAEDCTGSKCCAARTLPFDIRALLSMSEPCFRHPKPSFATCVGLAGPNSPFNDVRWSDLQFGLC